MKPIISYVLIFLVLSSSFSQIQATKFSRALTKNKTAALLSIEDAKKFMSHFLYGFLKVFIPSDIKEKIDLFTEIFNQEQNSDACNFSSIQFKVNDAKRTADNHPKMVDEIKEVIPRLDTDFNCVNADGDSCLELLKTTLKKVRKELKQRPKNDLITLKFEIQEDIISEKIKNFEQDSNPFFDRVKRIFSFIYEVIVPESVKLFIDKARKVILKVNECLRSKFLLIHEVIKQYMNEQLNNFFLVKNVKDFINNIIDHIPFYKIGMLIVDILTSKSIKKLGRSFGKLFGTIVKQIMVPGSKKRFK